MNIDLYSLIINSFIDVIKSIMDVAWQNDDIRQYTAGAVIYIISFGIVGKIMRFLREHGIWLGSFWGKVTYFVVSSIVGTIFAKLLLYVPIGDIVAWWFRFVAEFFRPK